VWALDVVLEVEQHDESIRPGVPTGPRGLLRGYIEQGRLGVKKRPRIPRTLAPNLGSCLMAGSAGLGRQCPARAGGRNLGARA